MSTIESVSHESRLFEPPPEFVAQANINQAAFDRLNAAAADDYPGFWAKLAREELLWHKPFSRVLDESQAPFYKWFEDGELNASYNCLDRNLQNGNADKTAIIFEADDGKVTKVTYQDLYHRVCRLANGLKSRGIKKGDRVIIYMPMSIEGVVAMQACARIGATHSVVFGGFSAKSLHERIIDAGAVAIITADEQMRGGKALPLKAIVDEALAHGRLRRGQDGRRLPAHRQRGADATPGATSGCTSWSPIRPDTCEPEWVGAEHPLFILYTSGSTGKPKGVQHSTGGYLLWAMLTMKWTFDIKPTDVFWCTADIGWVTGHTLHRLRTAGGRRDRGRVRRRADVSRRGPLLEDDREAQGHDLLHRADRDPLADQGRRIRIRRPHPTNYDLSSLRMLGTVGEPINPEAWMWYYQQRRRRALPDRRYVVADRNRRPHDHAAAGRHAAGAGFVHAAAARHHGRDRRRDRARRAQRARRHSGHQAAVAVDDSHHLGRPGALQEVATYPEELGGKLYLAGDGAMRDKETGYFTIMGRIDDVLNVSGHRLGTMEIESALVANALVAEAAVVGRPDETDRRSDLRVRRAEAARGQPATRRGKIAKQLRDWVGKEIGPIAKPKDIRFGDNLPKTRSGKIMRRLLRSIAKGEEITQDVSTLENPAILEQLKQVL